MVGGCNMPWDALLLSGALAMFLRPAKSVGCLHQYGDFA